VTGARRQAGFTLLEVMVAMALLAGAMAALSDLAGSALRNHEAARDLNAATLLARARMAELEEQYEDSGFKDFDEDEQGDFASEGRPDLRWKLKVIRPAPDLSADQLISHLAGATSSDPADLATKLLGGLSPAGQAGASGPTTTGAGNPAVALVTTLLQAQLTAFGEIVKRSLREVRLTVTWPVGKRTQSLEVVTHLVVINPRAPGGARGDSPDVPPAIAAAAGLGAGTGPAGLQAPPPTQAPGTDNARPRPPSRPPRPRSTE